MGRLISWDLRRRVNFLQNPSLTNVKIIIENKFYLCVNILAGHYQLLFITKRTCIGNINLVPTNIIWHVLRTYRKQSISCRSERLPVSHTLSLYRSVDLRFPKRYFSVSGCFMWIRRKQTDRPIGSGSRWRHWGCVCGCGGWVEGALGSRYSGL